MCSCSSFDRVTRFGVGSGGSKLSLSHVTASGRCDSDCVLLSLSL